MALLFLLLLEIARALAFFGRCRQSELSYRGDGTGLPEVYRQLLVCPNMTSLELDMTMTGCILTPEPWHFTFRAGDRFPPLKKLSLANYDLAGEDTGVIMPQYSWTYQATRKTVDLLRFTKMLPSVVTAWDETNLEKWQRAMDFTHIEDLYLDQDDGVFYDRMKNELPALRRLSLRWPATPNATASEGHVAFLQSVPPLAELSIRIGAPYQYDRKQTRTQFPLTEILAVHCPTLKSLALKQSESEVASQRRPMLNLVNVTAIHEACPNLTHLELDIDRNATTGWPLRTFNKLTEIESLTNLTLRLELGEDMHAGETGAVDWNHQGLTGRGPFREPRMNQTTAEALFARLREQKKGERLKEVVFEVGDFVEKPYMGPLPGPGWGSGRARKFVCEAPATERKEGSRYGLCKIVGDEDPFPIFDEVRDVKSATKMWGAEDDEAVDKYLTGMRGER